MSNYCHGVKKCSCDCDKSDPQSGLRISWNPKTKKPYCRQCGHTQEDTSVDFRDSMNVFSGEERETKFVKRLR